MSAFLVSDKHINTMVSYAMRHGAYVRINGWQTAMSMNQRKLAQQVAEILKAENIRSMKSRYGDRLTPEETDPSIVFRPAIVPDTQSPSARLKSRTPRDVQHLREHQPGGTPPEGAKESEPSNHV